MTLSFSCISYIINSKTFLFQYKRDVYDETELRGPFNANKLSRYVELVLVADNREYRANGESLNTVHRQLKDVANIINSVSICQ